MSKLVIIMGVSGSGKTTVGQVLSNRLNIPFFDADDFHPNENINKMKGGTPLNDDDRKPWLQILNRHLLKWKDSNGAILACSGLKESYRRILSNENQLPIHWVMLTGSRSVLEERLKQRAGHFMHAKMLDSQLAILEEPSDAIKMDITQSPEEIVNQLEKMLI